ncbi:MAG: hypothetical protein WDN03_18605 [Rhizomicrobium sp.]
MSERRSFSRRAVTIGGGIALALGLGALGLSVPSLLRKRYRASAYDDLLDDLVDRDAAIKVGAAFRAQTAAKPEPQALGKALRHRLERRTLADVTGSDLAQSRMLEVKGWVMPETLVLLSVLASEES